MMALNGTYETTLYVINRSGLLIIDGIINYRLTEFEIVPHRQLVSFRSYCITN
jgi:hypothetical protein